jgi:chromosome segregation ATPase
LSDSPELLKPNPEVTDSELQIEIGNLRAENESLRQRFAKSQDTIEILNRGTEALNEQLATANQAIAEWDEKIDKLEATQAKNQRLQNDLGNSQTEVAELRSQLETERADRQEVEKRDRAAILAQRSQIKDLKRGYGLDPTPTENILRRQLADLQTELSELKQNLASTATLSEKLIPDAATILSQLRAKRKKSKTDLADLEAILEILENSAEKIEEGR